MMTRTVFLFAHHRKTFPTMKKFIFKRKKNSTRLRKDRKCVAHGMNKRRIKLIKSFYS